MLEVWISQESLPQLAECLAQSRRRLNIEQSEHKERRATFTTDRNLFAVTEKYGVPRFIHKVMALAIELPSMCRHVIHSRCAIL